MNQLYENTQKVNAVERLTRHLERGASETALNNYLAAVCKTSVSIAYRFHISDTYAHEVFDRYVKMDRLRLTDAVSVDEVHLDIDEYCAYALVIQDFHTDDPINLLRSQRADMTEPYFVSIPPEERTAVRYLIKSLSLPPLTFHISLFLFLHS